MSKEKQSIITIRNEDGLHARPAALIAQTLKDLDCDIYLSNMEEEEIDAKSILGIMMLAAERGAKLKARATGPDASKAIAVISDILGDTGGASER